MTATDDRPVLYDVERGIATITLNAPQRRNALSAAVRNGLAEALARAGADDGVRAVVLTGAGTSFCAGADLKEIASGRVPPAPGIPELLTTIMELPRPVVAVVNGPARAGGLGLVAACDLAIAPDDVTFAFTEVRIGVVPAMIAVVCRARMTSRALARYFLTGEGFTAAQAAESGLITLTRPRDGLDAAVGELLDAFRATEPKAVARTKRLLTEVDGMGLDAAFTLAERVSIEFFGSPEAAEGRQAFFEKRPPSWAL
ncbi:enoyl-CoA hydratase-related protein [Thermomonospora umbrina]|uniref:Enoyl-CoA hydratase/methylglutaconyl-CoA hydratase n=1 Tax=Thermomonospora umbrina TaxID=111806 RepID=A0A3D9SIW5_9ACTN|nr:enoyl-CoA hydratase-related protein [Thermomonospora umbrina]REE95849.1 enoyl-CoA hydratase/methylglutaconyl-CoA hydratase [Thermomonospora umbrina]